MNVCREGNPFFTSGRGDRYSVLLVGEVIYPLFLEIDLRVNVKHPLAGELSGTSFQ